MSIVTHRTGYESYCMITDAHVPDTYVHDGTPYRIDPRDDFVLVKNIEDLAGGIKNTDLLDPRIKKFDSLFAAAELFDVYPNIRDAIKKSILGTFEASGRMDRAIVEYLSDTLDAAHPRLRHGWTPS